MDEESTKRAPRPPHPTPQEARRLDMHALRTPLTVAMLRVQILRRHLRRGDDAASLSGELDQIDAALAQLALAIDQLDHDGGNGRHG